MYINSNWSIYDICISIKTFLFNVSPQAIDGHLNFIIIVFKKRANSQTKTWWRWASMWKSLPCMFYHFKSLSENFLNICRSKEILIFWWKTFVCPLRPIHAENSPWGIKPIQNSIWNENWERSGQLWSTGLP